MSVMSSHSSSSLHNSHQNNYRSEHKIQMNKESREVPSAKNDTHPKSRSEAIKKLITDKQQEKELAQKREKQQKEAKDKSKNSFRIPKKKPDVEKLISSLFDDTETKDNDTEPYVSDKNDKHKTESDKKDKHKTELSDKNDKHKTESDKKDKHKTELSDKNDKHKTELSDKNDKHKTEVTDKKDKHKTEVTDKKDKHKTEVSDKKDKHKTEVSDKKDKHKTEVSDKKDKHKVDGDSTEMKNPSNKSSSSHKEKHSASSNNLLDKGRETPGNAPEKPLSSVHNHQSHKSHSSHKSSSSSSKQSEHKSGVSSDGNRSSSASKDHRSKSSSSSEIKSSSKSRDPEHSGKDSSSSGAKHSSTHSSSSKNHSSSSKQKEPSSSKPELKPTPSSSKPELKPSPPSSKLELKPSLPSSKSELKSSLPSSLNNASSPRSTVIQPSTSDQQPIVLNKHHLHPIVERQASSGLSEKEKILARLQAIKQRTLEAIHKENSGKRSRFKGEKSHRKSKNDVKHDDKTKSVEICRDIVSSDEEGEQNNGVPSALDIMLSERNAKLEKEKISRMAKQAWERATKKDTDDSDKIAKVKKKHRSSKRDRAITHKHTKSNKDERKGIDKMKDRSLSPHDDSKKAPQKPRKPVIVRHSVQAGAPPMDFKAILEMAEKKQKEPPKLVTAIQKKKKEEDKRPLTQNEKDRIERKKSKDYQDWLKFGGKPPPQNGISDDDEEEEIPTHSSYNSVDKKHVSSYSTSTDKHKASLGSSKQSFNKNTSDKGSSRQQHQVTANGDSNNKLRNITINENVLVCGPAVSSDDEGSLNPFDRIMGKKRPAPPSRSAVPAKKSHFDDSDAEYDSDMDDFIDDGGGDEPDYSQEIKKLFGYDKSKYKFERDDDLSDMEADYTTVMKEEKLSAKIGKMEDLEDIKKEQEELRRKAMLKKKK